jgi:hypothetical protein
MTSRRGFLAAASLIGATDALVLGKVAANRSRGPVAAMELTERELHLVRFQRDSTALFLEIQWEPSWARFRFEDGPGWFDRKKLEELGFDCRLPPGDPPARARYRAMLSKTAFLVFEYRDNGGPEPLASRLHAVDAGRRIEPLRDRYADARRFLIAPALVRLRVATRWDPVARAEAPGSYLRGAIERLLVGEIYVPPPMTAIFQRLKEPTREYLARPEAAARGPRFAAVVAYGRNHEPWLVSCRLLGDR